MTFSLYRFLLMPIVVTLLPIASLFHAKVRVGLRLRLRRWDDLPPGTRPIWIHAASGEFEYAKAVIREIKALAPESAIVVTYFSPTFAKAVTSFPGVDLALPLPLDLPGPCRSFLRRLNPRLLLIARTDLWPEMLHQCHRARVPIRLFSYTQKEVLSPVKRAYLRWMLGQMDRIDAVTTKDQTNLAAFGIKSDVLGDTRYDQVLFRLEHPKPILPALHPSGELPILVAGSTWDEDEAVLIPALAEDLRARRLKLVLVPHEPTPDHLARTERALKAADLSYARYSAQSSWDEQMVLLVDQVGVLAELYLWADLAFVGGSYRKTVHSVMEALGSGALTILGPKHANNREALEFRDLQLGAFHGVEVAADVHAFRAIVRAALDRPKDLKEFQARLRDEFKRRLGASARLARQLV